MFSEEEFSQACNELDSPDLRNWEFFTQSDSHDIEIFRFYNEKSGLYSYKIFGTMDAPPETCSKVYMDLEYRKEWDPYLKDIRETTNDQGRSGIYWLLSYPFPLSKRDFVYVREMREVDINGRHIWVILSKADDALNDYVPVEKGIVRIRCCTQTVAITSWGENGSKAFSYYYDDPGGLIPTWFINWAAKTGIPAFLGNMQKACQGYQKYLQDKNSEPASQKKAENRNDHHRKKKFFLL